MAVSLTGLVGVGGAAVRRDGQDSSVYRSRSIKSVIHPTHPRKLRQRILVPWYKDETLEVQRRRSHVQTSLNQILNISTLLVGNGDGVRMGPAKEQADRRKHGVDFRTGSKVFLDPYVIEFDDLDAVGEPRFNAIGLVDGRMLFVTYSVRGDLVRMISARGAEPHEKRKYHEI